MAVAKNIMVDVSTVVHKSVCCSIIIMPHAQRGIYGIEYVCVCVCLCRVLQLLKDQ